MQARATPPSQKLSRHTLVALPSLLARIAFGLLVLAGLFSADLGDAAAVEQAPFAGRWIDVNLSTLTATAYDGAKAVYSAPVTAGKKGFATPTGTYRIFSQVRVTEMRSSPGSAEWYDVKNVQYVQYFKSGGYAIHANYWAPASVFGRSFTSHGCISMSTKNAAYFWKFAGIGTPVYIHFSPPTAKVTKVVGKGQAAAKSQLQSSGFKVNVAKKVTTLSDPGIVVDQKPSGGVSAVKGSTVTLYVAAEPPLIAEPGPAWAPFPPVLPYGRPSSTSTWAPMVVGLSEQAAVARIEQAGLRATYVNYVDLASAPASMRASVKAAKLGTVVAALTAPGTAIPSGADYMIVVRRK